MSMTLYGALSCSFFLCFFFFFFFQAEDGIRVWSVTGVQTCALPICGCHVGGIGVGHRLDDNRMSSPDFDTSHVDHYRLAARFYCHEIPSAVEITILTFGSNQPLRRQFNAETQSRGD